MLFSISVNVPDNYASNLANDDCLELELRNYRNGYHYIFRRGEFACVAGESGAEVIALRILAKLKEWAGEAPLDASKLNLKG